MGTSNSYGLIALLIILLLLLILYGTGRKSVYDEIIIKASRQKVWEVLTETKSYPEWNPTMLVLEGELILGNKIKYQFTQYAENKSEIQAKVVKIEPNKLLNQKGGITGILTYNHTYTLRPEGQGTKVIIHEVYKGIGVNFWDSKPVEEAYAKLNEALKQRVESLN